jgi:hypothetical protein
VSIYYCDDPSANKAYTRGSRAQKMDPHFTLATHARRFTDRYSTRRKGVEEEEGSDLVGEDILVREEGETVSSALLRECDRMTLLVVDFLLQAHGVVLRGLQCEFLQDFGKKIWLHGVIDVEFYEVDPTEGAFEGWHTRDVSRHQRHQQEAHLDNLEHYPVEEPLEKARRMPPSTHFSLHSSPKQHAPPGPVDYTIEEPLKKRRSQPPSARSSLHSTPRQLCSGVNITTASTDSLSNEEPSNFIHHSRNYNQGQSHSQSESKSQSHERSQGSSQTARGLTGRAGASYQRPSSARRFSDSLISAHSPK